MKRNAKRYFEDGIQFDSRVEYNFYLRFIRGKGYHFRYHERFYLTDKYALGGVMGRAVTYTPDFVIRDDRGKIAHVYDVKGSLTSYDIDRDAKKTFSWFQSKYRIPVEVIVPRANDFKMKVLGVPNSLFDKHIRHDKHGNIKRYVKTGNPMHDYYDIHSSLDYDIRDTIGGKASTKRRELKNDRKISNHA